METRSKRQAVEREHVLREITRRAKADPIARALVDRLVTRDITVTELYFADVYGNLDELAGSDPMLTECVERLIARATDSVVRLGCQQLLGYAPEQARLSFLKQPRNISDLCHQAERDGRKRNTVRRVMLRAISTLLRFELSNSQRNRIFADLSFPAENDSREIYLNADEIAAVLTACEGEFETLVRLAISTGGDRGVLLNLRCRDVSIFAEAGRLTGSIFLADRKTDKRSRKVGIAHEMASALLPLVQGRAPSTPVFGFKYHQIETLWSRARSSAGLDHVRFKDLRHTFAVLAMTGGVDLNTVKASMGHTRLSTTTRYLSHATTFTADQAAAVEEAMRQTG